MKNTLLVSILLSVVIAGGGGFYAGMTYQKSQSPSRGTMMRGNGEFAQGMQNRTGASQQRGVGFGGMANGEVVSKDDMSMTLKLRDGGSKIVFFASSTKVGKASEGTLDDVAQGSNVLVVGSANSDGSILASQIQIQPDDQGFPMGSGAMFRGQSDAAPTGAPSIQ